MFHPNSFYKTVKPLTLLMTLIFSHAAFAGTTPNQNHQAALIKALYEQSKENNNLLNCRDSQGTVGTYAWTAYEYPISISFIKTGQILASGVPRFLSQQEHFAWGSDKSNTFDKPDYGKGYKLVSKKDARVIEYHDTSLNTVPGGDATSYDFFLYGRDKGHSTPSVISIKTSADLKSIEELTFHLFIVEKRQEGDLANPKFTYLWKIQRSLICKL